MRTAWKRLVGTFRKDGAERDLDDEVGFHLQMQADEFQAQGMSPAATPRDARSAAWTK